MLKFVMTLVLPRILDLIYVPDITDEIKEQAVS